MEFLVTSTIVVAVLVAVVRVALPRVLAWRGVYLQRKTKFGPALIFDSTDDDGTPVRLLNVGGTFQSVTYLSDDLWCELVCTYHRTFADVLAAAPRRRRAVVVGGGGYSFPKYLITHDDQVTVDAVEIDPAVTDLARRYFFLDRLERDWNYEGRLRLVCDDGWAYLRRSTEPFDLVVNDAFSGNRPLGPLGTAEGAAIIHAHLEPGGIYLANVRAKLEGRQRGRLDATTEAFAREFAHVYVLPERTEEPSRLGNNVLVACDEPLDIASLINAAGGWTVNA